MNFIRRYARLVNQFTDLILLATAWDIFTMACVYHAFGVRGIVTSCVFELAGALFIIAIGRRQDLSFLTATLKSDPEPEPETGTEAYDGDDYDETETDEETYGVGI